MRFRYGGIIRSGSIEGKTCWGMLGDNLDSNIKLQGIQYIGDRRSHLDEPNNYMSCQIRGNLDKIRDALIFRALLQGA